ncbi:MAG: Flp pilus assembly protein CpaB, partial [Firmicutes bacterium HGW-Firmicutes-13]
MKTKKVILFALIFGLLSAGSIYWYVLELEKQHNLPLGKVLVAKTEIPANSQIDSQMFECQHIPVDYIHPKAVKEEDLINGTITKTTLVQGEQLLADKLVTGEGSKDGLAYSIEPGYRAVSISITKVSAVSHLIKPGDNIDVVVTLPFDLSEGSEKSQNEIITTYV